MRGLDEGGVTRLSTPWELTQAGSEGPHEDSGSDATLPAHSRQVFVGGHGDPPPSPPTWQRPGSTPGKGAEFSISVSGKGTAL